jgi:hypothetical protein
MTDDVDEDPIRTLVARLARADRKGGLVIERAAILASGADLTEVMRWIDAHAGRPEATAEASPSGGLYGARDAAPSAPRRYVLPAEALG